MSKKYCVLYHPGAGIDGKEALERLKNTMQRNDLRFVDFTSVKDCRRFVEGLDSDENLVIAGGDGMLNQFVNATEGMRLPHAVYYYACGQNNDFARGIDLKAGDKPMDIVRYLQHLPQVTVNGKSSRFVNAVGYGVDGYVQEVSRKQSRAKQRAKQKSMAMRAVFGRFKPVNATVTVDGVKRMYSKVWLVPTMFGRFECGGMQPTNQQMRLNKEHLASVAVIHGGNRLKMLAVLRALYNGKRVSDPSVIDVRRGKKITVEFDQPEAVHIDGEPIPSVYRYDVDTVD